MKLMKAASVRGMTAARMRSSTVGRSPNTLKCLQCDVLHASLVWRPRASLVAVASRTSFSSALDMIELLSEAAIGSCADCLS